jgi:hypothetical protein
MIAYTVHAEFDDEATLRRWVEWLGAGHLAELCASGALDAEAIMLDPVVQDGRPVYRGEARYHFASREAFGLYEREHAPRLRAEGLRRFPIEKGVRYRRTVGEVAATRKKP